jgi:D-sedoheptulose 7-phosphate isomerase
MSYNEFFENYFKSIEKKTQSIDSEQLEYSSRLIKETHNNGGKVIVVGNGGSAAIASHVSIDLTKAANIRSINFNEASLLTCFSNDYGYEHWVEEAIKFYADKGDLVILISSSGQSKNIINGALKAKEMNLPLITLSGFMEDNPLRNLGDINLWVDSSQYNFVEATHLIWLLSVADYLIENSKKKEKL